MEEFNELIFMLEDMETSDVNLIYEYMNSFCSKYYKSRNGKFHYLVETEIYNMGSFIMSEFFEFPGDPSIIEFPGNPSTLELVSYIKDIEKAFYSLPPEEIASSAGFSSISGLSNIEGGLGLENLSNDDKTYSNGPNIDLGLDLSNILSIDFDIEDLVILSATATAGSLVLNTLHSQNGVDENETNNGPFSWLTSLFSFYQSSSKPV
ncbi:hypothetical protein CONCODRAFT_13804 [Conidiobolus coronatus NRRL 28638]|uniref:Uncharacterized protein n=1 Tax=Conidiobolus coronatus (strain ATCC 28846 / CBS 209.66 / NRRL 28638) TaxID=796925 RepID=A0A137NQ31_CONC2|nr:hypothetical protein CONCODRAFT_13804 [Conidiobolus coronatus NRRL 28638]|eukprot:KXN64852.1 hypothetical protein CONCODRAFT_13804 [Conidiobolus coronatus NRRL 28638]